MGEENSIGEIRVIRGIVFPPVPPRGTILPSFVVTVYLYYNVFGKEKTPCG
jgi:hypothetical protein